VSLPSVASWKPAQGRANAVYRQQDWQCSCGLHQTFLCNGRFPPQSWDFAAACMRQTLSGNSQTRERSHATQTVPASRRARPPATAPRRACDKNLRRFVFVIVPLYISPHLILTEHMHCSVLRTTYFALAPNEIVAWIRLTMQGPISGSDDHESRPTLSPPSPGTSVHLLSAFWRCAFGRILTLCTRCCPL
jgi:hypothetical protein